MRRILIVLFLLMTGLLFKACQIGAGAASQMLSFGLPCPLEGGCGLELFTTDPAKKALTYFSQNYTCPVERVSITPIEGVTMRELMIAANDSLFVPSDEIKNDPSRLALWQKEQAKAIKVFGIDEYKLYQATGCDHTETLACKCPQMLGAAGKYARGGTPQSRCSCERAPVPR